MDLTDVQAGVNQLALPYRGREIPGHRLPLVELTGGEPLLQEAAIPLMTALCNDGFTVLLETSGARDISAVDERVHRIMDLKCPSSGESHQNLWSNIPHLRQTDEVKFVIATWEDVAWARAIIEKHRLTLVCPVLFSWVHPLKTEQLHPALKPAPTNQSLISRRELVELIIREALPVRFQAQLHKLVWPPEQKGV